MIANVICYHKWCHEIAIRIRLHCFNIMLTIIILCQRGHVRERLLTVKCLMKQPRDKHLDHRNLAKCIHQCSDSILSLIRIRGLSEREIIVRDMSQVHIVTCRSTGWWQSLSRFRLIKPLADIYCYADISTNCYHLLQQCEKKKI